MPRPFTVIISPKAAADLEGIHRYIARDSLQNADGVVQAIMDAVDSLVRLPGRHPLVESRPGIRRETRVMVVNPYLIYYHVLDAQDAVRVVTVRHGARRQPRRFP
jgi:plasmid stabilization system protein ParE